MQLKKIVVLEGNDETAAAITNELNAAGFEVCAVSNDGARAEELIREYDPDAVLISMTLKNVDGFGVMEKLKASHSRCKILASGNFNDDETINAILRKGAKYYMMRPLKASLLVSRVKELFEESTGQTNANGRDRKNTASLDEKISNIFISIGIPPHIKGYAYLREGIKMAVENPSIINNITKQLYPKIAEKFDTTSSKVERAIRHSIEVAWNRQRIDAINAVFGVRVYIGTEKPTNSEFIALVADKLILEGLVNG